jgi:hypothetical protein
LQFGQNLKSTKQQTNNNFMLYKSFKAKVDEELAKQQLELTISEIELMSDESVVVECKDADNKEYSITFVPDADNNYTSDGAITPTDTVTQSEEEGKKIAECKADEMEGKTAVKADEYMAKVAKAVEEMEKTCSKMNEYMSKTTQAKSETKDEAKEGSDELTDADTKDTETKGAEAKAKTATKNWWESVKSNY